MRGRAPAVEVFRVAAVQQGQRDDVGDEPDDRDQRHGVAVHWRRHDEALHRLEGDPAARQQQQRAVDEGREHRHARMAEAVAGVGGLQGLACSEQAQSQRAGVRQHVSGIGDEGQRAADHTTGDADDHRHHGDAERPGETVVGGVSGMIVRLVMIVRVGMVVVVTGVGVAVRGAHGRRKPALRSRRAVAIRGRPIRAVGSRDCTSAIRVMPRPSIFAEPAQSKEGSAST